MRYNNKIIFVLFCALLVIIPNLTFAKDFTKIFYYVQGKKSFESFKKNAAHIDVIAPQSYGVNADGDLSGGLSDEFLEIAKKNDVKIMPLVVNSRFSKSVLEKILDDVSVQDKIIKAMVEEGERMNYLGWQFDFEQMTADKRDKYTAFVKRAYPEFKKNGQLFSVAVIAQHSLNPNAYPNNLWQRVIGVYDYKEIGRNSDFISIMSYDQPDSKGAVATLPWVKKVIRFAIGQVPAEKISLGIPFYFWKWDQKTGKMVDMGGYGRISELTKGSRKQAPKWGWDSENQVAFVDYYQNNKKYRAWYENAKSFSRKIDLAMLYKLHGFSAWTLGLEDPNIYPYLAERVTPIIEVATKVKTR